MCARADCSKRWRPKQTGRLGQHGHITSRINSVAVASDWRAVQTLGINKELKIILEILNFVGRKVCKDICTYVLIYDLFSKLIMLAE